MIKILKASAGSGKTHELAGTYIDLLLDSDNDYAYRNILAVTFTNKATDEMKSRILKDLFKRAKDSSDPQHEKAARVLSNILHDYSAFSVSTIDKFFQQTLRAFAHELGHFSAYQVELDKQMLAEEAVDEILDTLDSSNPEDEAFINFVLENVQERLENGKGLNIEGDLKDMALQLKSESFRVQSEDMGLKPEVAYSTSELSKLKRQCIIFRNTFRKKVRELSVDLVAAAENAGLKQSDWNYKWFDGFYNAAAGNEDNALSGFTAAKINRAANPDGWFSKGRLSLLPIAQSAVGAKVEDFLAFWNDRSKTLTTVDKIQKNIYGLGVACRLWTVFERIQKEKNVVCLDESNSLLKKIIDGSDAPFVYAKVGVRLDHYLLDEFQDTSVTQWDNFKPLLMESNSHDGRGSKVNNLIVGDVKQSIYRWRDSDWKLLDSEVQKAFPGAVTKNMEFNYRSDQAIVDFNNAFYPFAAKCLDGYTACNKISSMYADCYQKVGKEEHLGKGKVYAEFYDDSQQQLNAVVDAVKVWHSNGVKYGDIAVLVRKNDKGTEVARALIDSGIQVITEAALSIKSSVTVRRIVSMMSLVNNPADSVAGNMAESLNVEIPASYHSLAGLCDDLYAMLQSDERYCKDCEAEAVYVTAFMDFLMDYTHSEGNNLGAFLEYWKAKDPCISSPLSANYVKITSIHKSKGLDFPYVIVPFLEDLELYHQRTQLWCRPEISDKELAAVASDKLFRVSLSSKDADGGFGKIFAAESFDQAVDAINMMYVATTRASHEMLLMGTVEDKKFSSILAEFRECNPQFFAELPAMGAAAGDEVDENKDDHILYKVYPIGDRLAVRPYAADFFNEEGKGLDEISGRSRGIVLHEILSRAVRVEDLPRAVEIAVEEGKLSAADSGKVLARLQASAAKHPDYFVREEGERMLAEQTIVNSKGEQERPDRVLLRVDGSVLIVDYKFGDDHASYSKQLDRYRNLFLSMGYSAVEAHLWFPFNE